MPEAPSISGKALLSAVLGVLALPLLAFTGVPALLLGLRALREVNESDGQLRGRGLALAGMLLGAVGTLGCVVFSVALGLLHIREVGARSTCNNNLRRLGQVVNLYHDVHGRFPAGTIANPALPPEQRWSGHASLLVFLDRDQPKEFQTPGLWKEAAQSMHVDEPWNAEANRATVNTRLRSFVCPSYLERPEDGTPGLTTYVGLAGVGADAATLPLADPRAGVFGYDRAVKRADAGGGISNTIMVMETGHDVGPWAAGGPPTVRGLLPESTPLLGVGRPWGGLHPSGVNVLMLDGSAVFLNDSIAPALLADLVKLHRE